MPFSPCSNIQDVDAQMDSIREQMEVSNQIREAISSPHNLGIDIDEDELKDELAELEDQQLQERLAGAERVPVHSPVSNRVAAPRRESLRDTAPRLDFKADIGVTLLLGWTERVSEEQDEEAMLRQLQAEMAS